MRRAFPPKRKVNPKMMLYPVDEVSFEEDLNVCLKTYRRVFTKLHDSLRTNMIGSKSKSQFFQSP